MIVTNNRFASLAAKNSLEQGGNAIDAAIAAAFVLGLTEPQSSGLGGGGYALSYQRRSHRLSVYNGREWAPESASPYLFLNQEHLPMPFEEAVLSLRSIGVPGEVALLETMHQKEGHLSWKALVKPARQLALKGFPMSRRLYDLLKKEEDSLRKNPEIRRVFFRNNHIAAINTLIKNPDYAESLSEIAVNPRAFYQGKIAKDICNTINHLAKQTLFSLNDFKQYKVNRGAALCSPYRSYTLCTTGAESGGVTLLELMKIFARNYASKSFQEIEWMYQFLEASKLAYADKYQYLADPAFVPFVGEQLLASNYIQQRAKLVSEKALKTPVLPGILKRSKLYASDTSPKACGTTSISIVDTHGDAVSITLSIEQAFGSHLFVDGFFLNNELTDFSFLASDGLGHPIANSPKAHKRPASMMSPVMVFNKKKRLVALTGSPGGGQIACYLAKNLIFMLDFNKNPKESSQSANLCSNNFETMIEANSSFTKAIPALKKRGENINTSELVSGITNIKANLKKGWWGAADPRREGVAIGE